MQRTIRFPESLESVILAKASAEDRSFSWVVLRTCEQVLGEPSGPSREKAGTPAVGGASPVRGSAPARTSASCPDCGKRNGVHKGDCPRHPGRR